GHMRAVTPMKRVPILANFEEWMKMATDNKINAANSWNFALIDYFHDMSLLKEGDSVNFQKASCTLDGCVKIYTSRVDSVATETGKLLSGLADSRDSKKKDREDGGGSGGSLRKKINPKVMNMIDSVEKKEMSLKHMMKTVLKDKHKIEETIATLDEYKRKASGGSAGTRMFEDRKEKALKTMAKKDLKLQEITELLRDEIEPKLEKLRQEKRAFLDFQQTQ
uniref:Condensin complex subunit 2,Structural maintenance of chromosomes protein,Structural maintenance of chromosomes protein n=1 Tax=Thermochaetoides thermophila TaxID=209285 RepID=UPI0011329F42|nr:Chain A, Condensin complex subunit 2,Structural maintenance of chromosomes protein,Structural maintenance of chromosomes protein [Thermochaetoides thermophila]